MAVQVRRSEPHDVIDGLFVGTEVLIVREQPVGSGKLYLVRQDLAWRTMRGLKES
jgi:hypothetical protein